MVILVPGPSDPPGDHKTLAETCSDLLSQDLYISSPSVLSDDRENWLPSSQYLKGFILTENQRKVRVWIHVYGKIQDSCIPSHRSKDGDEKTINILQITDSKWVESEHGIKNSSLVTSRHDGLTILVHPIWPMRAKAISLRDDQDLRQRKKAEGNRPSCY